MILKQKISFFDVLSAAAVVELFAFQRQYGLGLGLMRPLFREGDNWVMNWRKTLKNSYR